MRVVYLAQIPVLVSLTIALSFSNANANANAAFVQRQRVVLEQETLNPSPTLTCSPTSPPSAGSSNQGSPHYDACIPGKLDYALAALWLNKNAHEVKNANTNLLDAMTLLQETPGFHDEIDPQTGLPVPTSNNFHFDLSALLFRIDRFFGPGTSTKSNELTPAVHQKILSLFADFAHPDCRITYTDRRKIWTIIGSENHNAMAFGTCWASAELLAHDAQYRKWRYADGSSPQEQLTAWTKFFKAYESEHAKYGLFIEYFSATYSKYSLESLYNIHDFSSDPTLVSETRDFLNLWWANWAQQQLDGMDGGSKARFYQTSLTDRAENTSMNGPAWLYFNLTPSVKVSQQAMQGAPANMMPLTSSFQPAPAVAHIALQSIVTPYEALSRELGLQTHKTAIHDGIPFYPIDISQRNSNGGIFHYTYCTPSFLMGTSMYKVLNHTPYWASVSDSDRMNDLVLHNGQRVVALPVPKKRNREYNALFGMQYKGVQILAPTPILDSVGAGPMSVWLGHKLKPVRNDANWMFINYSGAYVALRPVVGKFQAESESGWIPLSKNSAVVIEAAQAADYTSFAAFQQAELHSPFSVRGNMLRFTGAAGDRFTFYLNGSQIGEINGKTLDTTPAYAFRSPFLNEDWGSGQVQIGNGNSGILSLHFPPGT